MIIAKTIHFKINDIICIYFCDITVNITCPEAYLCRDDERLLQRRRCIYTEQLCDGKTDCLLGDDEIECGRFLSGKLITNIIGIDRTFSNSDNFIIPIINIIDILRTFKYL